MFIEVTQKRYYVLKSVISLLESQNSLELSETRNVVCEFPHNNNSFCFRASPQLKITRDTVCNKDQSAILGLDVS